MELIKNFLPNDCKCDTHRNFEKGQPSVITIHYVGPFPGQTVSQVREWWEVSDGEASAHYVIKDDIVLQCWPLTKVAWHAGCKAGNNTSIGIEVIPKNSAGEFSDRSIATLKELLDSLPRLPIVRHYDWTGKACPAYYTNNDKWQELLKKLGR